MKVKNLSDCEILKAYLIESINVADEKLKSHLENIFIKPNNKIIIKRQNIGRSAFIVEAEGINYAIDKKICEKIKVYDL